MARKDEHHQVVREGAVPGNEGSGENSHSDDINRENANTGVTQNGYVWTIPPKTTATVFWKGPQFYWVLGFIPIPVFTSETLTYIVHNGVSVKGFWLRQYIVTGFIPTEEKNFSGRGSTYSGYAFIIKLRIHNHNSFPVQIDIRNDRYLGTVPS